MVQLGFAVELCVSLENGDYDAIVIVGQNTKNENNCYPEFLNDYLSAIDIASEVDGLLLSEVSGVVTPNKEVKLVVYSPTGPINRDYDDVRRYKDAAIAGVKRALKSKKKNLLLVVSNSEPGLTKYKDALLVSVLGAFEALYVPLEVRESSPANAKKVNKLGISSTKLQSEETGAPFIRKATALEWGRIIARDIGGSDPERMCPLKVEEFVREVFKNTSISINVVFGHDNLRADFPLFAAVDRCANMVERHRGRIIYLEYCGEGEVENSYFFVGKGVTYDTGGADVKAGGHMAGMHRDKCGAATIAGLFAVLNELQPKGIRVVARLAIVRNSIGAESYVADEIITSKAGCRVRVGNTDAEGRMAMTDSLYHCKEEALNSKNPHLFTIATLTGHAIIAMGDKYTIALDNGAANMEGFARHIQELGDCLADPFEVSMLRREDFQFASGRNEYEDALQCNNEPSSRTPRGHQFPAAFMIKASGLDKHGIDSDHPIKYTHLDIAGSSGPYPGIPTGCPLPSLTRLLKMI
ncbi:putative aminopeptidase W07G4.4 isoform X1 [Hydra vulgaris]|uniref:putative aminopeptidase W07G4.4 isoform X1 n=1 Tax=Hydra vulgaris TaxID=6087 RepID=UPI001F5F1EE0|nr:putative aminopeptidase W07G4.4 [Hydra vulgaris]